MLKPTAAGPVLNCYAQLATDQGRRTIAVWLASPILGDPGVSADSQGGLVMRSAAGVFMLIAACTNTLAAAAFLLGGGVLAMVAGLMGMGTEALQNSMPAGPLNEEESQAALELATLAGRTSAAPRGFRGSRRRRTPAGSRGSPACPTGSASRPRTPGSR